MKTEINPTYRKLVSMMRTSTGRAMCDSGDAYGRNWERNQKTDLMAQPKSVLVFKTYGADFSNPTSDKHLGWLQRPVGIDTCRHNILHWLENRLQYDPQMQGRFTRFANKPEHGDDSWFETLSKFVATFYGDINTGREYQSYTVNTYNEEDMLSQVLQYTVFKDSKSDNVYVALMIHQGCDVRGGYTAPVMFTPYEYDSMYPLSDNAVGTICCKEGHYWDTDNGGYTFKNQEDGPYDMLVPGYKETGCTNQDLRIDKDGNGFCPICHTPLTLSYDEN